MSITRKAARPMLASMFIMGGVDAIQNPETKAAKAQRVAPAIARRVGLPDDPETLVRINGGVMFGAGAMLAMGWLPRLAATALAASTVPTTLAGHRFWEETDKQAYKMQHIQFFKNVSMLGGLMIAAVDTGGRPSLPSRARRAAAKAKKTAAKTATRAREVLPAA